MSKFNVPTRNEVSESNQAIFDQLQKKLGFVPNLYAYLAKNDSALGDYLNFSGRNSTLSARQKEIINLVVSQQNECSYCLAAHTQMGKMNGFTEEQILQIRAGENLGDSKLDALVQFTRLAVQNGGKVNDTAKENLFAAGYNEANIVDIAVAIGTKSISNYIHNIADFEVDFPAAAELTTIAA